MLYGKYVFKYSVYSMDFVPLSFIFNNSDI